MIDINFLYDLSFCMISTKYHLPIISKVPSLIITVPVQQSWRKSVKLTIYKHDKLRTMCINIGMFCVRSDLVIFTRRNIISSVHYSSAWTGLRCSWCMSQGTQDDAAVPTQLSCASVLWFNLRIMYIIRSLLLAIYHDHMPFLLRHLQDGIHQVLIHVYFIHVPQG